MRKRRRNGEARRKVFATTVEGLAYRTDFPLCFILEPHSARVQLTGNQSPGSGTGSIGDEIVDGQRLDGDSSRHTHTHRLSRREKTQRQKPPSLSVSKCGAKITRSSEHIRAPASRKVAGLCLQLN